MFSFFEYILYIPRYLLPVFPLLAIVFSYSILEVIELTQKISFSQKIHLDKIVSALFVLLIAFMGYQAMAGAYNIHYTVPAPVQAANFITANYDPDHTVVFGVESRRHFEYYLRDFKIESAEDETTVQEISEELRNNNTVISEATYPLLFESSAVKSFEFNRDYKIYPKQNYVKVYEYKPIAEESPVVLIGKGFYNLEQWDGIPTRWMDADSELFISSKENYTGILSFKTMSFNGPRTLEIYSENTMIFKAKVPSALVTFDVPVSLDAGVTRLKLHVPEGAERPSDTGQGEDSRYLSIVLQDVETQEI